MNLYIFNELNVAAVYGIGTYIRELAAALKNSDINLCVVNLNSDKPQIKYEKTDGILHLHFPSPVQWDKELQSQWDLYHHNIVYWLRLHIKDKKNLIFHLNYNQKGGLARELKKAFNCQIVLTIHYFNWCFELSGNLTRFNEIIKTQQVAQDEKDIEQQKESIEREKKLFQIVDHLICLSNNTRQILQNYYKLNSNKITTIYNGLTDTIFFIEKSALRQKFHISPDTPIILFVGRLDPSKGLNYALQAFRIILKTYPNCRFIIAGNGRFNLYMTECEDIWMNVTWTGFLSKEKLYELYAIADIGVMPSFHEQCSYVAIEMMMCGLPIIASTTTGLAEMIENKVSGLHIPVIEYADRAEIDSSLLAEKILYLLQHPVETKQMGKNGRRRYLQYYSSDIFRINMLKLYASVSQQRGDDKIKTLIVTGQNNHTWEVSHAAIKQILENSELFKVDVALSPKAGKIMSNFRPDFSLYQLVVLDYNGDRWPEETEKSFLDFVEKGGGVIIYHAANNAFRHWKEYNRIIGFGGWEERNDADGPYIYMKDNQLVYDKKSSGHGGSHGSQHEFVLNCGNPEHPITKGLPTSWRHAQDELYDRMRGPGIIQDVLFWAYSDSTTRGSGRDEIAIFTVNYGKARIFHTTLGHAGNSLENNIAMQCTGFQVTLLRGAEWAATGKVTQPVPDDFPTETTISLRKNYK
ncbi:TIGR04157 family glycosyltransferase [Parabacteroides sp. AM08-6]|uniref:TIGR04157 family glycosyltransferase n=1 Tax=Parabacteroides sp. AM08-6 TaxID=2292053 RepID=UPI000EFEF8AA|nr:TIGR04157 family glycosyltransferase [Parabacteroides sp. AM08-6]RHJ85300.1 TIGR04157 family glycosyltransferase [Parabacteroides sp. AM08-6]